MAAGTAGTAATAAGVFAKASVSRAMPGRAGNQLAGLFAAALRARGRGLVFAEDQLFKGRAALVATIFKYGHDNPPVPAYLPAASR